MEPELERMRQRVLQTKNSLSEKLDLLQRRLEPTVEGAKDVAEQAVETGGKVAHGVSSVMESMSHAFDIQRHARNYPWLTVGGSVVAGLIAGRLLIPSSEPRRDEDERRERERAELEEYRRRARDRDQDREQEESKDSDEGGYFKQGLDSLGGIAKGAAASILMQVLSSLLPGQTPDGGDGRARQDNQPRRQHQR